MPTRKPTRRNPRRPLQAADLVYLGEVLEPVGVKKVTATEARAILRDMRAVENMPPSRRRHNAVVGLLGMLSLRFKDPEMDRAGAIMSVRGTKKVPFFRNNVALYFDSGDENQTTVVYDAVQNRFDVVAVADFLYDEEKASYGMDETYGLAY